MSDRSRKSRFLAVAVGIGALSSAAFVFDRMGEQTVDDETRSELAILRTEVHALREDHARELTRRASIRVSPTPASSRAAPITSPEPAVSMNDGVEEMPSFEEQLQRSRERASQLDDILFQEQRDREWEADTESAFTRMLAEKLRSGVTAIDILCRHTMCRIKLRHQSGAGPLDAIETIQGEPLMAGEFYVMVDPHAEDDAHGITTVYVMRPGWPLPPSH